MDTYTLVWQNRFSAKLTSKYLALFYIQMLARVLIRKKVFIMKASKCRESWLQTVLRLLSPQEDFHSTPYKTQGTTWMKGGENVRVSGKEKRHETPSCGHYTTNIIIIS